MKENILTLMQEKKFSDARSEIMELNTVDIAEFIGELERDHAIILFRILPKDTAVEVFAYLSNEHQVEIINGITDREIKHIIEELYFDDMIDMLEEMPASVVKKILRHTKEEERILINQFLNYPENSAGSLMTIEYVGLKKEMTVKNALEYIKRIGIDKETVYTCYVTDNNQILEGRVSLRKLVISDGLKTIDEIMDRDILYVHTHEDQEEIAYLFKKYDLMIIPVVDKEERLTGIITIDDIVDVIEQEDTEDFQRMAAIIPSESAYLSTGVMTLAKNRITWLLILMISATFSGTIIRHFENVLSSVVLLAAFIPMLMNTGGNAGAQSSTLVIRGLALGKIELEDGLRVLWKELKVSILVALLLSTFHFISIYFLQKVDMLIALTVCGTLFVTIVFAKLVGGILPIMAQRLKLDPAIMASPLITTIVDAAALMVYFSLASWMIGI
ncbi:MAG: magnesium transporter [Thermotaleaceae bacterium]